MTVPVITAEETEELPARFDWREEAPEILTPVKTQIGGTCWAYSLIGCAESNLIKKVLQTAALIFQNRILSGFAADNRHRLTRMIRVMAVPRILMEQKPI